MARRARFGQTSTRFDTATASYSFQGDLVLDPFAGIGTVGIACLGLERRYYLVERVKAYVDEFARWRDRLGCSSPIPGTSL
jgi:DNA modification methylase